MNDIETVFADFSALTGRTLTRIDGLTVGSEGVTFTCTDGTRWQLCHFQACCEHVRLVDIVGVPADVIGSPLTLARMSASLPHDAVGHNRYARASNDGAARAIWTYYALATVAGYVDLRWLGESNGYYAERVDFVQLTPNPETTP